MKKYSMEVFGEVIYEKGTLTVFELDGCDIEKIVFDEITDT